MNKDYLAKVADDLGRFGVTPKEKNSVISYLSSLYSGDAVNRGSGWEKIKATCPEVVQRAFLFSMDRYGLLHSYKNAECSCCHAEVEISADKSWGEHVCQICGKQRTAQELESCSTRVYRLEEKEGTRFPRFSLEEFFHRRSSPFSYMGHVEINSQSKADSKTSSQNPLKPPADLVDFYLFATLLDVVKDCIDNDKESEKKEENTPTKADNAASKESTFSKEDLESLRKLLSPVIGIVGLYDIKEYLKTELLKSTINHIKMACECRSLSMRPMSKETQWYKKLYDMVCVLSKS